MICEICGNTSFKDTSFYYTWNAKEFKLIKCTHCGLITQNPKPDSAELQLLYSEEYFKSGAHGLNMLHQSYEESRDKLSIDSRIHFIKNNILKHKPGTESIFEIGFAMGHLLAAAKEMNMKVSGIEFSKSAIEKAKIKFGLDVFQGNFEDFDTSAHKGKWDCVFGGDVFEHFAQPVAVCKNVKEILADEGIAVFIIPSTFNLFSTYLAVLFYRLTGKRKKLFDKPYHLYEYNTSTIRKIFAKHFTHVRVINNIKKPSELNLKGGGFEYKMKYLIHLLNYPYTKLFNRNGDRITVIAKK